MMMRMMTMTEMGQGQPQGTPPPPPPFGAPPQKPKGAPKGQPNQGQPQNIDVQELASKIRNEYMARTMNTYDFIQQAYGELMGNLLKPIMEKNQALEEKNQSLEAELLKIKKQAPKPKKGTGRIVEKAKTNKPAPPK